MLPGNGNGNSPPAPGDVQSAIAQQGQDPAPDSVTPCPSQLSYIEIGLIDCEGNPVPNEPYCVTDPKGQPHKGTLDQNGQARVDGIPPGTCYIAFTDRDQDAWDRV